ncbi:Hepatocyte nuclear factor 6 [Cichlidogyrus casuarinus]|uniref:Hepatocyte nuclear factor 6 n=1 Tax=Cichlidogyrus casuarinus TaxID=1844966 RepID=A0ABD2PWU3_9PLAT
MNLFGNNGSFSNSNLNLNDFTSQGGSLELPNLATSNPLQNIQTVKLTLINCGDQQTILLTAPSQNNEQSETSAGVTISIPAESLMHPDSHLTSIASSQMPSVPNLASLNNYSNGLNISDLESIAHSSKLANYASSNLTLPPITAVTDRLIQGNPALPLNVQHTNSTSDLKPGLGISSLSDLSKADLSELSVPFSIPSLSSMAHGNPSEASVSISLPNIPGVSITTVASSLAPAPLSIATNSTSLHATSNGPNHSSISPTMLNTSNVSARSESAIPSNQYTDEEVKSFKQESMTHDPPSPSRSSVIDQDGGAPSSPGTDMEELNTKELAMKISGELKRYSIPQAVFAQRVLCRSQGTLSDLLRNPKPWSKLKSGRETFRRMWKWLNEPEYQRMSSLRLATCKRRSEENQQMRSSNDQMSVSGESSAPNPSKMPKKPRLVFTDIQRRTLHAIFKETKRPSKEMQATIAQQLNLEVPSHTFPRRKSQSQQRSPTFALPKLF